ncbi:DUF4252 domain-containing protein [Croceitalea rosinachiae]|uniref:DUF4252 domain-containing protein n=1 Tax=Croceitalea rosinachiae TaxID=3075596 RepID=A0ABU3AEL4_9FLAO|nr:DUF4252 domain-containing protein [Croceitalea sp. F388]MDT0607321.1 DUF4252 domain-containing protein [Croceitalea sp. F388]
MKKTFSFLSLLLLFSCGSYNSIDSFYEAHKNDNQVTAIRVPQFMLTLVSEISPEMKSLVGNTRDLRYMQFPSKTKSQTQFLNNQMNNFASSSFIEVFRKNNELKRNVVSIREKRDVVKEILIYNNDNTTGSFLYFNGNFDPMVVRKLAKTSEFDKFSNGLLPQMNLATPGISN